MRQLTIGAACALTAVLAAWPAAADDLETRRAAIFERVDRVETNEDGLSEAERLEAFLEIYFDYAMLEYPEFATYIGHAGDHHRWTDNSLAAGERRDADQERALAVLETIDRDALDGEDRLNYDLLHQQLEDGVAGTRFQGEYLVLNQLNGVHQNVSQMAAIMRTTDVAGYEDLLARLAGVGTLVDNDIAAMRIGLEKGVTPPKVTMRDVPQQVENLLVDDPITSPLLQKFTQFPPSIPEADQERLRAEAVTIYNDVLAPAYTRLHEFLVEEYVPGCRT